MRPPTRRASDIGQPLAYQWSLANLRNVCSPFVYRHYLSDAVKPEYAVMLRASWGAGKTYFIKHYLDMRSRAQPEKHRPGYQSCDIQQFRDIYAMVKNASEEVGRSRMQGVAAGYVARLAVGQDSYPSLYEYGVQVENYGGTPFLHHVPVEDFAQLLIVDSRSNDQLFASLAKRYEHDFAGHQALADEYNWTDDLKSRLLSNVEAEPVPFAQLLRARVGYYFELIGRGIGRSDS